MKERILEYIAVLLAATHLEDVLEIVDLRGVGVGAEAVLEQVVLEIAELFEMSDRLVGGLTCRKVVFVINYEVRIEKVFQLLDFRFLGLADTVAGRTYRTVMHIDVLAEAGGTAVAGLLLTAGLGFGALAGKTFFTLDTFLFEVDIMCRPVGQNVDEVTQTQLVDVKV